METVESTSRRFWVARSSVVRELAYSAALWCKSDRQCICTGLSYITTSTMAVPGELLSFGLLQHISRARPRYSYVLDITQDLH